MGSNEPASSSGIIIRPDDTSLSVAQAIYHHVTAKTERIFESYSESYVIEEGDIIQLFHCIKQSAQRHHDTDKWSCTVDHALYKKERVRHSSFETFRMSDRSQSTPTSEIVIVYDFMVANPFIDPNQIKPERYKITVHLSQENYLISLDHEDLRPSFLNRIGGMNSLSVSVQYVDYTIARSIITAIREWKDGLTQSKTSKISKFLAKHQFSIGEVMPPLIASTALIGTSGFVVENFDVSKSLVFLLNSLAFGLFLFALGKIISDLLLGSMFFTQTPTTICITNGDKTHKTKLESRIKKHKAISLLILTSIVIGMGVNLLSSWIFQNFLL